MVNANAKTPDRKRKSIANTEPGNATPSPNKKAKQNENAKTPAKTPKAQNAKTPKPTPAKTPKQTPGNINDKSPKPNAKTPKKTPAKPKTPKATPEKKKNSGSEGEGGSPKKLQKFPGTAKPKGEKKKRTKKHPIKPFTSIKEKVKAGDKDAIVALDEKIKALKERNELTKTAKRKMRLLQKLRRALTGEKAPPPQTTSAKRRERRKNVKGKPAQKGAPQAKKATGEEDEESSEYEVEAEIQPGQILKSKDGEDEEMSGEAEEDSDEEEDDDSEEQDSEEAVEKNQGGKKKNEAKKSEVKAKNLKLQAMRKQGQLAGSVKQNQKRSFRRAKQTAVKVNGSNS